MAADDDIGTDEQLSDAVEAWMRVMADRWLTSTPDEVFKDDEAVQLGVFMHLEHMRESMSHLVRFVRQIAGEATLDDGRLSEQSQTVLRALALHDCKICDRAPLLPGQL